MPFTRIALLIEPASAYGRGILHGVATFARTRPDWSFQVAHGAGALELFELDGPRVNGVIVRTPSPELLAAVRRSGLPCVAVSSELPLECPCVATDDEATGRMAGDMFATRGYRRVAFVGWADRHYAVSRAYGLRKEAESRGMKYEELRVSHALWEHLPPSRRAALLEPFLQSLPRPSAVLACHDEVGHSVLEACRAVKLRVPEDLSVLGVDNDAVLCELANPNLSSIQLGTERIGYLAAETLAGLLTGTAPAQKRTLVPPMAVVTRRSSDHIAVDDNLVQDALHYIWQNSAQGIQVSDLVGALGVSRRWLELRFRRAVGCSPATQIRNVQIERAKKLLAETDLLMPDVARASGFHDPKLLIAVFRREVGLTPTGYREKFQLR